MNQASTNRFSDLTTQLTRLKDRVTEREEEILKIKSSTVIEKQSSVENSLALSSLMSQHTILTEKMNEMKLKLEQNEIEISILQQKNNSERETLTATIVRKEEEYNLLKENSERDIESLRNILQESNEKNILQGTEIKELNEILKLKEIESIQSKIAFNENYETLLENERNMKNLEITCSTLQKQLNEMKNDNQILSCEMEDVIAQYENNKNELLIVRTSEESVRATLFSKDAIILKNDALAATEKESNANMINSLHRQIDTMR